MNKQKNQVSFKSQLEVIVGKYRIQILKYVKSYNAF